jgi:cytochrome P450
MDAAATETAAPGNGAPDYSGAGIDFERMGGPEMASAPQPVYKMLRDGAPILRMDNMVLLSKRADIDFTLRHPEIFSSNMDAVNIGNIRPMIPLQIDPPDHLKYRKILDPIFAPRQVAKLEEDVTALVQDLVSRFADRGECDFSAELAVPLPSQVFLTLLGLPLDDLATFIKMKDGIIRPEVFVGDDLEKAAAHRHETALQMYAYFERILDERERERRDDLLSQFLDAEIDGHKLSRNEILDVCFLFLIAGLDTVTSSLECFTAYLAQHPEHRQELVDDESLIPQAVEELLRWETPVTGIVRVALDETEIGGCTVHKGDMVAVMLGAANTDEAEYPDGDVVDFHRETNKHIAFGGGVHRCLGSHLARLELRVALREFHRRIPSYSIKDGVELEYTPNIRSIEHLPLVWESK